jgi:hypothetical protein
MEELLEEVFSIGSVPMLYNEDKLPLRDSLDTAVRSVGGWCEVVASLRTREQRNVHCWKTLPSNAVKNVTKNSILCVTVICKV